MPLSAFYFPFLPFSPFSSLVLPVFNRFPSATCHLLSLSTLSTLPLAVYFPRPLLPCSSSRPEWHAARNLTHRWPSREFSWNDTRIARPISFLRSSHGFVQRCVTLPSRSCVWKLRDASKGPSRAFVCYIYTFTFVRVRLRNTFVRLCRGASPLFNLVALRNSNARWVEQKWQDESASLFTWINRSPRARWPAYAIRHWD